jgi:hypothetical protein
MLTEKRFYQRFKTIEDVFVSFNESYLLGKIKDISYGGLCFEYISSEETDKIGALKKTFINIWTPLDSVAIANLPCETVYDCKSESIMINDIYDSRRCGIRFLYTDDYLESEINKLKSRL